MTHFVPGNGWTVNVSEGSQLDAGEARTTDPTAVVQTFSDGQAKTNLASSRFLASHSEENCTPWWT